jgi:hypothetical protein
MSENLEPIPGGPNPGPADDQFRLPNTFRVQSANKQNKLELESVLSQSGDYRAIRLTCAHTEQGSFKKLVALNLTLEEQIGFYSLLSKEKEAVTGKGLKILRPGKSLILDAPRDSSKSGLVMIFGAGTQSVPITLTVKSCIIMSGLFLRSIGLNIGVDSATSRYLINQWRPTPQMGMTDGGPP